MGGKLPFIGLRHLLLLPKLKGLYLDLSTSGGVVFDVDDSSRSDMNLYPTLQSSITELKIISKSHGSNLPLWLILMCPNLTSLDCSHFDLDRSHLILEHCKELKSLHIRSHYTNYVNSLFPQDEQFVVNGLGTLLSMTTLTSIHLELVVFSDSDQYVLIPLLQYLPVHVLKLHLSLQYWRGGNICTIKEIFTEIASRCVHLETLKFELNGSTTFTSTLSLDVLQPLYRLNQSIRSIHLYNIPALDPSCLKSLPDLFPNLTELHLHSDWDSIPQNEFEFSWIMDVLSQWKELTSCQFAFNRLKNTPSSHALLTPNEYLNRLKLMEPQLRKTLSKSNIHIVPYVEIQYGGHLDVFCNAVIGWTSSYSADDCILSKADYNKLSMDFQEIRENCFTCVNTSNH